MAIVAGIDEAGVGPVLGPLVVCSSVFEVPDARVDQCLWKQLAGTIARKPARKSPLPVIGDSKKLFKRNSPNALAHLERTILALLATRESLPETFGELLQGLTRDTHQQVTKYPWYSRQDFSVPRSLSATDIRLAANALKLGLEQASIRFLGLRAEPILTGEFNRVVRATDNKATTVLDVTSRLMAFLWGRLRSGHMRIYVDRQGGRMRYLDMLERIFEGCQFRILEETEASSIYEVHQGDRQAQIHFAVGGDDKYLPVSLASMTSKYLREVFMEMFNEFWIEHLPELQPTAGYYTDGNRFFGEISPVMEKLNIHPDMIYRCR